MNVSRIQIATFLAILFHTIGLVGILFFDRDFFIRTTSINLLLMFSLLVYTQRGITIGFLVFTICCIVVGIGVEIIGTKTGWLFGEYSYGTVLGPTIEQVPYIIGVNWFIVIYCAGISIHTMLNRILEKLSEQTDSPRKGLQALSIIADGATLAVLFDWLIEPVAVKLGYWQWLGNGNIPFYNYLCWFVVSALLLSVFHFSRFSKSNKFAVNLLLIQVMFFLLLRTFL